MRQITKLLLGAVSALALAQVAHGQAAPPGQHILNGQIQLNPVTSTFNAQVLNVTGGDFAGTSVAYANTLGVSQQGVDFSVVSTQDMQGATTATLNMNGNFVEGVTQAIVGATANIATVDGCCGDSNSDIRQTNSGPVTAGAVVRTTGTTNGLTSGVTAFANTVSIVGQNGQVDAYVNQTNAGSVRVTNDVDMCCTTDAVTLVSTAGANAITGTGDSATYYLDTEQRSSGQEIISNADIYAVTGYNVAASSTAIANSVSLQNQYGYTQAAGYQENSSFTHAESYVTLDNWTGYGAASAYGVGNSVAVSNVLSDTRVDYTQNNFATGEVTAIASFTGGAGGLETGSAQASATALGNAITGTLCGDCSTGGGVYGSSTQFNYANVTATATINTQNVTGGAIGSAVAVGNSATFGVVRSGH